MVFEFDLGEMRVTCSSLDCIRRLVDKGARLADPRRTDELRRALESAGSPPRGQSSPGSQLADAMRPGRRP
jgi:hypothetical protein